MHDPYFDRRLDANALPPLLRVTGIVLSLVVAVAMLLDVFAWSAAA